MPLVGRPCVREFRVWFPQTSSQTVARTTPPQAAAGSGRLFVKRCRGCFTATSGDARRLLAESVEFSGTERRHQCRTGNRVGHRRAQADIRRAFSTRAVGRCGRGVAESAAARHVALAAYHAAWKKFVRTDRRRADGMPQASPSTRPPQGAADQVTLMSTGEDRFPRPAAVGDIGQAMVDQGLTFPCYGTMINIPGYQAIGDRSATATKCLTTGTAGRPTASASRISCNAAEGPGFHGGLCVNIEETPQDMADMIEYLNGPVTSEAPACRETATPEPYGVKYIGIGNE